ncbi:hypothetical protein [Butyrivibrio sp. WCD3002]|uniref:hypothetical protein n=1 Tax=Butyrivibrio sp. WCD3002 TaxID=1280676 RepID=UPI000413F565|nr:hypothetical protein [Butyrivibrio sp. WCD3002]
MKFGESELLKEKNDIRLLKIGCKNDREVYCVLGNGPTRHFEDYDDALEEYNLRWMKIEFGE